MTQHHDHAADPVVAAMIAGPHEPGVRGLAEQVIDGLLELEWTVCVAESLTGGGVCAALTSIPGASGCVRGGVVSYSTDIKHSVLDVSAELLRRRGAVDAQVAEEMARGAAALLGADCAMATKGSAGPDPAPGGTETEPVEPGVVFIAVHTPSATWVEQLSLRGDRAQIRLETVQAALQALVRTLRT